MKPDTSTIGGRLRLARVRAGKTQEQVAFRLRISHPAIAQWEGNKTLPPTRHLVTLCDYLGITPSQLLGIGKPQRGFLQVAS